MSRAEYTRPSSAATWVVCSGSIDMRAMFPSAPDEADTEVTEDGTACHWLAAEIHKQLFPAEGTLSPNGRVLTDEMFDAVDMYLDVLRAWANPNDNQHPTLPGIAPAQIPGAVAVCEQMVSIPSVIEGMKGTPDAWAYNPTIRTLYIADLKFGFRFVEVWDNWQLICYAAGLLDMLKLDDTQTLIEFVIVQPRCSHRDGPVRKWRVRASDLRTYINQLHMAAAAATQYTPNPGCPDCPGRHICVAYQNAALRAVEISYTGSPHELDPAALGAELRLLKDAAKKIEGRITGLEAQADSLLRKGAVIPGWVLAASYAREGWKDGGEAQIITLGQLMGANVTKPIKAITPAQARKVLPANIVAMYAHKPSTGVRLTKQDPYEAQKAFDNGQ